MSDLLKNIDRRTKLAGMNRMELMLYYQDAMTKTYV
jgi:hypothetical protein